MKYSELKSYLELARWENESDDYYIKVYRNGYTVAEVGLWEQYNIRILDPTQMTEGLYRRLTELAKPHSLNVRKRSGITYGLLLQRY